MNSKKLIHPSETPKVILIVVFLFLYIVWQQSRFNEDVVYSYANEMNVECDVDAQVFYEKKGFVLQWVAKERATSSKMYAYAQQKWALPWMQLERYDLFNEETCDHIVELSWERFPKAVYDKFISVNDMLRDNEPEYIPYR